MFKTSFDIYDYFETNTRMFAVLLKAMLVYAQIYLKHVQLCTVTLKTVLALAHILGFQGRRHRLSRMIIRGLFKKRPNFCYKNFIAHFTTF